MQIEIPVHISLAAFRLLGYNVDVSDDKTVLTITKDGRTLPPEEVSNILYSLGVDIDRPTEISGPEPHRLGNNPKVYIDYRVLGTERSDMSWIRSGNASDEAFMASCKMKDMFRIPR